MTTIFSEGQVWKYTTREGEESSRLIILKVEDHADFGIVVHIAIEGLAIENPESFDELFSVVEHLPFAEAALAASVTELESSGNETPQFDEGYERWLDLCDTKRAGVWQSSVAEAIQIMEDAINIAHQH